ncbi:MAG: hypothetical protein HY894_00390 [Deltaproteobacteria bacterium]|nr:hypothetical protein [Deltaproteobacteria bacterium]
MDAFVTQALLVCIGAGLGVIGYFLKALHRDIKEGSARTDEKISMVERDFMEFKAELPRTFVMKDDYIRTIASFDLKLDSMDKKMDTLMGRRNDDR